MTTTYHSAIATGAAANASTFNTPLGALDAQLVANAAAIIAGDAVNAAAIVANAALAAATTAEVVAARASYSTLTARLGALALAGSSTSVLTNGVANAGQKDITVDSTTGFLPGALIGYTLVGGVIETNTVGTVTPTVITCTGNVGTGGIANDTYVMIIALGSLVSTGAVTGATISAQTFTVGVKTDAIVEMTPNAGVTIDGVLIKGGDVLFNVSLGMDTLEAVTTGYSNAAFGARALAALTTGYGNTAIGKDAMLLGTVCTHNTAIGAHALQSNLSGQYNVGIGIDALAACTESFNIAIGGEALAVCVTGSGEVVIGHGAGTLLQAASNDVVIGYLALSHATTSASNVAIGTNALYSATTVSGNVAVGMGSLYSNLVGTRNVAIGFNAGYYETGSSKLFIDAFARASEAEGRTKALIYGVFDAAEANQILTVNGSLYVTQTARSYVMGNLGVGIAVPTQRLHVLGDVIVDNTNPDLRLRLESDANNALKLYQGGNYSTIQNTYNYSLLLQPDGGNIAVGAAVPAGKLHVDQSATDGAIPALLLDQADISEGFIDFVGTSAASAAGPISSWTTGATLTGFVRVEINGAAYWMPYYTAPSS